MTNNQATRQSQAAALDSMIDKFSGCSNVSFDFATFAGSYQNPLQTFRLLSIDLSTEWSIEASTLAKLTGLPASAFTDEVLTGVTQDELLTALGQCALVWLECVRAQIRHEITEAQSKDGNPPENHSDGVLSAWDEVRGMAARSKH